MPEVDVVIGLDAGTTSTKYVAIDRSGDVIAQASSDAIPTAAPSPGASIQRPSDIWSALASACQRGSAALPADATPRAVAVAAQSGSVVPIIDGVGAEAITWMDTRSRSLVESWSGEAIASIRARSGWMPTAGLGLSTISWLGRTNRPKRYERFASVDDYLVHALTGHWLTNPSNASGMQLMDVWSFRWSDALCSTAGIDPTMLSPIRPSGERAGTVTPEAANVTGLPDSTPVAIGGHDQACAALGLGVVSRGDAFLSMGTAWVLTIVVERPETEVLPDGFNLSPHVVPGFWTISRNLGGLGAVLDSFLGEDEGPRGSAPESPDIDDPYFLPSIHDPDRTDWGTFTGDPADRLQPVMEACAFEARKAVEEAESVERVRDLIAVGGGTRSDHLLERLAAETALPVTARPDASWPAIGAGLLAAQMVDWPMATPADLPSSTIRPQTDRHEQSERRYREYCRLTAGARP